MKTLGQIAMEAFDAAFTGPLMTFGENKERLFEAAAQAVRNAVIEECAKVCEETVETYVDGDEYSSGFTVYGEQSAKALRNLLKAKKGAKK